MKEIIEGLNLPKQVIDKTEKFMSTLFGPSAKEIGELFADKIRYSRMKNQIKIFKKTMDLVEEYKLEPKELKLKTLVPLIESSSLEEEELLQDKWANLIANISSSPESGFEPKLIKTLSNLSAMEAQAMDYIHEKFLINRRVVFERNKDYAWKKLKKVEDVKFNSVLIRFKEVKTKFKLTEEFTRIIIENLESLGLIKYQEPEIEIDSGTSDASIRDEEDRGPYVELDLDMSASFYQSDDFNITTYGNYFVHQCRVK